MNTKLNQERAKQSLLFQTQTQTPNTNNNNNNNDKANAKKLAQVNSTGLQKRNGRCNKDQQRHTRTNLVCNWIQMEDSRVPGK